MKKLFVILVILAWVIPVGALAAGPYLVCDPANSADEVLNYKLFFDGAAAIDHAPVAGAIKYDLAPIAQGSHTVKAQACNVWGCSADSLPFVFNKKVPSAPASLRVQ